jgi:hypothetical protein
MQARATEATGFERGYFSTLNSSFTKLLRSTIRGGEGKPTPRAPPGVEPNRRASNALEEASKAATTSIATTSATKSTATSSIIIIIIIITTT